MEAERLKAVGQAKAAENKKSLLAYARKVAKGLASDGRAISADDVQRALSEKGISVSALGNAAGSLFRESCWEWTKEFVKSARPHSHANLLRLWKLR